MSAPQYHCGDFLVDLPNRRFLHAAETLNVRARFEPPFAARLPARIEALIGREAELAMLGGLLEKNRAVTVLGAGGMGKTRCALEAARRAAPAYADEPRGGTRVRPADGPRQHYGHFYRNAGDPAVAYRAGTARGLAGAEPTPLRCELIQSQWARFAD